MPPYHPRTAFDNLLVLNLTEAAATEMRLPHRPPFVIASANRQHLQRKLYLAPAARPPWFDRKHSTLHAYPHRPTFSRGGERGQGVVGGGGIDPAFQTMDEEESRLVQDDVLDELLARWQ